MLDKDYGVQADVWSATSYTLLRREAMDVDRWNMLHPTSPSRKPYVTQLLEKEPWPVIASSDYMRIVAEQISPWVPGGMTVLGTDGFGRSEARKDLRRFFEVDAECITLATLHRLARAGSVKPAVVQEALQKFGIDPDKPNPMHT
jgi:pyruvate dehydrogenase E1 component